MDIGFTNQHKKSPKTTMIILSNIGMSPVSPCHTMYRG